MWHAARRWSQAGSHDAGSHSYPRCVSRTGRRKSRGCCGIFEDQPPHDIRMDGTVSARWMGSVEGQAAFWKTAQAGCARHAMGLQHGDAEESVATEVRVRAVDA